MSGIIIDCNKVYVVTKTLWKDILTIKDSPKQIRMFLRIMMSDSKTSEDILHYMEGDLGDVLSPREGAWVHFQGIIILKG